MGNLILLVTADFGIDVGLVSGRNFSGDFWSFLFDEGVFGIVLNIKKCAWNISFDLTLIV